MRKYAPITLNMIEYTGIAAFLTQGPGNYSICLSGQKILATIYNKIL